jgi:type I restriction enzyme, S subunit
MSELLPVGWAEVKLHNCINVLDSRRIPVNSEERANRQGNIPYYGATGQVGWIDDFIFNEELVLIGEDGAPFFDKAKPIAYIIQGKSWVNNHAHVLRAITGITTNQYLKYFFDWFDFHDYVNGTTRLKLTQGSMNEIPMRLAPIKEQSRIVAKLEKLLEKVESSRTRLEKIPATLKRFRQSVLAAACSGRLTADWRNKELHINSSDQLLDGNEDLPNSWRWKSIRDVASSKKGAIQSGPFGSNLLHSEFQPTGILVIGIDNVFDGKFSLGKQHRISHKKYELLKKYAAHPLDVLVTVMATVGRCCVVPSDVETAIITKHVYRITVDQAVVNPYYFMQCIRGCPTVLTQVQSEIQGVTRPGINGAILKRINIPLPPIAEQNEIVRRVEELFALADRIEARYQKAKAQVDKLTQSILAKAFRGELVPQNPNDEPASELLKRIKVDGLAKSRRKPFPVIPTKVGIQ